MANKLFGMLLIFCACLALHPTPSPAQGQQGQLPGRSVVYSLEPGEEIMDDESVIAVSVSLDDVDLVITRGEIGPFFVFRDGKKQGPFARLEEAMAKAYEGRKARPDKERACAAYKPGSAPEGAEAERADVEGGQAVQFKGKTAGPFVLVYMTSVTPGGARAYFTAGGKDSSAFVCTDGRKVEFGGLPTDFKFSPDGQHAAVLCQGSHNVLDPKLSSLPLEKLEKLAADMDQMFLYTIEGKKFGPFDKEFDAGDFWYPANSNDLYFKTGGQLFRNGAPMMKVSSLDPCTFYPSADGQKYVLFNYENIVFSDGRKFPAPLDIVVFAKNGQTMFKWITLENKKNLVVYERAM